MHKFTQFIDKMKDFSYGNSIRPFYCLAHFKNAEVNSHEK